MIYPLKLSRFVVRIISLCLSALSFLSAPIHASQFQLMIENKFDLLNASIPRQAYICDILVAFDNGDDFACKSVPFDIEQKENLMPLPKNKFPSIILVLRRKAEDPKGSGIQTMINFLQEGNHWLTHVYHVEEQGGKGKYTPLMPPFHSLDRPNSLKIQIYFYSTTELSSIHIEHPANPSASPKLPKAETTKDLITFDDPSPWLISFSTEL